MTPASSAEDLHRALHEESRFAAAVVFGSTAVGGARPESDVDVAVLYADDAARGSVADELLTVLGRLGLAARRDVHLVDIQDADCELRRSIFATGVRIFDRSEGRLRALEAQTLLEYFDWEHARRIIDAGHRRHLKSTGG